MKRPARVVPILAVAALFMGCSQLDSATENQENAPATAPETEILGGHGEHEGCVHGYE